MVFYDMDYVYMVPVLAHQKNEVKATHIIKLTASMSGHDHSTPIRFTTHNVASHQHAIIHYLVEININPDQTQLKNDLQRLSVAQVD